MADSDRGPSGGTVQTCRCGCGTEVRRQFAQGHDQILLAHLRSEVAQGKMTTDQAMSQAATISTAFGKKVAKSMAIVASQKAREARREQPIAAA